MDAFFLNNSKKKCYSHEKIGERECFASFRPPRSVKETPDEFGEPQLGVDPSELTASLQTQAPAALYDSTGK